MLPRLVFVQHAQHDLLLDPRMVARDLVERRRRARGRRGCRRHARRERSDPGPGVGIRGRESRCVSSPESRVPSPDEKAHRRRRHPPQRGLVDHALRDLAVGQAQRGHQAVAVDAPFGVVAEGPGEAGGRCPRSAGRRPRWRRRRRARRFRRRRGRPCRRTPRTARGPGATRDCPRSPGGEARGPSALPRQQARQFRFLAWLAAWALWRLATWRRVSAFMSEIRARSRSMSGVAGLRGLQRFLGLAAVLLGPGDVDLLRALRDPRQQAHAVRQHLGEPERHRQVERSRCPCGTTARPTREVVSSGVWPGRMPR